MKNNVRPELANYMMMLAASPWIGSRRLFMTAEGQTQLVKLQGEFEKLLEEKKMNVTQIIDRVSLDCEEMIIQCSFNENEIQGRDCCRLFTPVPTFTGKCYVFFANESFSQLFSGEMGGLIITLHQVENDEPALVKGILDPSKWLKRKLQITLINNVTHPLLEVIGHGPMITPNTLLSMQVDLQTIDNVHVRKSPDWSESECVEVKDLAYGDSDDFFFTEGNCMTALYRECTVRLCGCSSYFQDNLDLSPKLCSVNTSNVCINQLTAFMTREVPEEKREIVNEVAVCASNITSRCRRVCSLSSFKTSTVSQPLPSYQMAELKQRFGLEEQDVLTLVTIFYPLLEYEEVILSRKSYGDLLSDLGGSTGVFLGFSFITLMECFIFFVFCLSAAFRKFLCRRKKSAAKDTVAPPEKTNKSPFSLQKSAW
ncbi:Acid-sensing ion channel 4 [Penaeus vannamei]|uniref:Acid-sensing ion channel 4 n=1 Tax=Penaeus vannamei TaxID=6689 RepID=A0A423TXA5_PENVA|nr:Acid-sensing ion channel 4 [Penaeus vannamei]